MGSPGFAARTPDFTVWLPQADHPESRRGALTEAAFAGCTAAVSAPVCAGTAGWSLLRAEQARFPGDGTHLERYTRVLRGSEVNASFYRSLRPALYAKWADAVPADFRFSVKVPETVTHERRLLDCEESLAAFLDEVAALGDKLVGRPHCVGADTLRPYPACSGKRTDLAIPTAVIRGAGRNRTDE